MAEKQAFVEKTLTRFLLRNKHLLETVYSHKKEKINTMDHLKAFYNRFSRIYPRDSQLIKAIQELGRTALGVSEYQQEIEVLPAYLQQAPSITSFSPKELVSLWKEISNNEKEVIDEEEECKYEREKSDVKKLFLESFIHAISVDKLRLSDFKFAIEECIEILEECADYGFFIEHLSFNYMLQEKGSITFSLKRGSYFSVDKLVELLSLDVFKGLKSLDLTGNHLGGEELEELACVLESFTELHSLSLGFNQLDKAGAIALAPILMSMTELRFLDLRHNQIGSEGIEALNFSLASLTKLEYLNLSFNRIHDLGFEVLAPSFRNLKQMRSLIVGNNLVSKRGIEAIASILTSLKNLTCLQLKSLNIGAKEIQILLPSLISMRQLRSINLSSNKLGKNSAVAMKILAPVLGSFSPASKIRFKR